MQRFTIFTASFLILILTSSCASKPAEAKSGLFVNLTNKSKFFLLAPHDIEKPMDMAQQISASYKKYNLSIISWVAADETKIEMSAFNEMGTTMGELLFREGIIDLKSSVIPKVFKPEYIVADYQLCFYKTLPLRLALEKSGLTLMINENNRRIYEKNKLIIEILKNDNSVTLINHLRGYTFAITGDFE